MAEMKFFGIKLCIIPLPYTGSNHQFYNGQWYLKKYDDILIQQNDQLPEAIKVVLKEHKDFKKVEGKPKKREIGHATQQIVKKIFAIF